MCTAKTINWKRVTIFYDDFIIFAQFKIRRDITLRGRHVGSGSGVHIPRWVQLRKVERANGIFNVSWARCVDIESSLLMSRSKNSTLLRVGIVVGPTPIAGWVRTCWNVLGSPLLPLLLLLLSAATTTEVVRPISTTPVGVPSPTVAVVPSSSVTAVLTCFRTFSSQ